jgi:5-bromo-4-chloroindolyl phosphate hydrolysis protein
LGTLLIVKSRIQSVPDVVRLSEKFLFLKKEKKKRDPEFKKNK